MTALSHKNLQGMALAAAGFACLCLGDALIKKVSLEYSPYYTAFVTNLFSIGALLAASFFFGGPRVFIKTGSLKLHILRGFITLGVYLAFLYAITRMPIAQMYTLAFTQPFILALLAHFLLSEKIGRHRALAIVLGFSGVLIALRPGAEGLEPAAMVALLCAFLFACSNILVKFIDRTDHWMTYIFFAMLIQTPILFALTLHEHDFSIPLPPLSNVPWFAGAGIAYCAGLGLLPIALQRADASAVGALQYTGLLWGTFWGYLIFREIPTVWTVAGASIIVASGIYLIYREKSTSQK